MDVKYLIATTLLGSPGGMSARQLGCILKDQVSTVTILKYLDKMEQEKTVIIERPKRRGQKLTVKLSPDSKFFLDYADVFINSTINNASNLLCLFEKLEEKEQNKKYISILSRFAQA